MYNNVVIKSVPAGDLAGVLQKMAEVQVLVLILIINLSGMPMEMSMLVN